jgi:KaiC/GvpD/RAD55 family RecA-like ATPase
MERIKSGIPGFDELMEGGFEEGSINLLTGKTGTGKSIFSFQFIYNGAIEHGDVGLYITTEETGNNIKKQAERFGWDIKSAEKKGLIKIMAVDPFDLETLADKITESVNMQKAKRVVIDSVSMFELYMQDAYKVRKSLFKVIQKLRDTKKTSILVAEILEESKGLSRCGVIEFMVDSVIILQYLGIAKYKRSLSIRKMRMTDHSTDIHPFEIKRNGIEVHSV